MNDDKSWLDRVTAFFSQEKKTKEDLHALLHEFCKAHIIEADTLSIMEGAIQVSSMRVSDIVVPRSQMTALGSEQDLSVVLAKVLESGHSRFPVFDEKQENVLGVLLAKDLLQLVGRSLDDVHWQELIRPIDVVPESMRLDILFQRLRRHHQHLTMIVDEYGEITGLVTIEDVLEQIVGDIDDEYDVDDESYVKVQDNGQFIVKARMPLREFNDYFEAQLKSGHATTISGYLLNHWHRLPKQGEALTIDGFDFTVLNVDHRRIRLVSIKKS